MGANLNTNSFICILLGPCTPENWLATCKPIIETRMQKYVVLQSISFPSYSSLFSVGYFCFSAQPGGSLKTTFYKIGWDFSGTVTNEAV